MFLITVLVVTESDSCLSLITPVSEHVVPAARCCAGVWLWPAAVAQEECQAQRAFQGRGVLSWAGSKGNLWSVGTHGIPELLSLEKPSQTIVSNLGPILTLSPSPEH